jgi:hypothetical protein
MVRKEGSVVVGVLTFGFLAIMVGATVSTPVVVQEPLITWNLFLTAIIVPIGLFILFFAIKRLFSARDKKDDEIKTLLDQRDLERQVAIKERYQSFSETLCRIKERVEEIAEAQTDRVTWNHCNDVHKEIREEFRAIRNGGSH